jgi:hypothetical protein
MALKIAVVKNHLPTCPSPYIVRSESLDVVELEKLIELMASGRTTLTKTDILAAMQLYKEELQRQLAEGKTVKTPTGSFFLSASGSMETLDDSFLPGVKENNHDVRLHHRPDKSLEDAIVAQLRIVREERVDLGVPCLREVKAAGESGTDAIRAGELVTVKGLRLRFEAADQKQGLFFVDAAGAETRSPYYPMILPSTLMAGVPQGLAAGSYALILRAAVNGKDVREARLEGVTVAA